MAISVKLSTGLRNHIATVGSAMAALQNGFIDIYSGAEPATADADATGATKLVRISLDSTGAGLALEAKTAGVFGKPDAATWSGVNAATGSPLWFRHVTAEDTGGASTSALRIQGNIATSGAAMNITVATLNQGETFPVTAYSVSIPASTG